MTKEFENLSIAELMGMVNEVPEGRLPSKNALEGEDVLVVEEVDGAVITIFKNGYLIYTANEDSTVCTVHLCCSHTYSFDDGSTSHVSYAELPWYVAIGLICSERLDTNRQERERSKVEFHFNGDGTDWCDKLAVKDYATQKEEAEAEAEYEAEHKRRLARLREVKETLTNRQRQVVDLYFSNPSMTEQKVADALGDITQQGVHKVLMQALKKLQKNF